MRDLVDAFGDNIIGREFANEIDDKQEKLQSELGDKTKETKVPGWGSWTSINILKNQLNAKQRREQRREKNKALKRDPKEPLVIINEEKTPSADSYDFRVRKVPKHYGDDRHIFNSSIRQPVGMLFNTPKTFKRLVEPKIRSQPGVVIKPLKASLKGKNVNKINASLKDMPKEIQQKFKSVI